LDVKVQVIHPLSEAQLGLQKMVKKIREWESKPNRTKQPREDLGAGRKVTVGIWQVASSLIFRRKSAQTRKSSGGRSTISNRQSHHQAAGTEKRQQEVAVTGLWQRPWEGVQPGRCKHGQEGEDPLAIYEDKDQ
jgi:hypothetical protein